MKVLLIKLLQTMSEEEFKQLLEQTLSDGDDNVSIHKIRSIIGNKIKKYEKLVYNFYKDNNDGLSLTFIGSCYQCGYGVTLDYANAKFYYEKAVELGNSHGYNGLGYLYHYGCGVTLDYTKAKFYYEKAAERDCSNGYCNLGYLYQHGYGVTVDYTKAKFYYEKAAERDCSNGYCNLGLLYNYGYGVTLDYAKAKFYYEKAAELGNAVGFNNLGYLYQHGHGVTVDYTKAKFYYEKVAERDCSNGYVHLGNLYEEEKNYDKMAINYTKAYRLDNEFAISRINESPWILNLGDALLKNEELGTRIKIRDKFALQQASVGKFDTILALIQQFL
jgi:TPR repeat protein